MFLAEKIGVRASITDKISKKYFVDNLCRTCFMNGESCIYRYDIARHNSSLKRVEDAAAFMLMPFGGTLEQVYESQIKPCIHYLLKKDNDLRGSNIHRSDDASLGAGYIICQRICRQIQESQLVCAEISSNNSNVFYELGFAFAIGRDISLFMQNSVSEKRKSKIINSLGISVDDVNFYTPFEMLQSDDIVLWDFVWAQKRWTDEVSEKDVFGERCDGDVGQSDVEKVKVFEVEEECVEEKENITVLLADTTIFVEKVARQKLEYGIHDLCRGAVHSAIDAVFKSQEVEGWKKDEVEINDIVIGDIEDRDSVKSFYEIKNRIERSSIVVICTSQDEPMSYFWLGFSHGIEKTVIPITPLMPAYKKSNITIKGRASSVRKKEKLPFDVRALWHIHFYCNEPNRLQGQLEKIFENAINGLSKNTEKISQKKFWKEIEESGSISIYVGSAGIENEKRHAVGEWDYKTVSEIAGYHTITNKAIELDIGTPIIQRYGKHEEDERAMLYKKIRGGNSIIVGSPDVNDMSEVALSMSYGLEPFGNDKGLSDGLVSVKAIDKEYSGYYFFQNYMEADQRRGFYEYKEGVRVDDGKYMSQYHSYDSKTEYGYSVHFAYLSKFKINRNHVVLLQGSTGPATLALAQILTCCINPHYTIYCDKKTDDERAEIISALSQDENLCMLSDLFKNVKMCGCEEGLVRYKYHINYLCEELNRVLRMPQAGGGVEALLQVYVIDGGSSKIDERLIAWIDYVKGYPRIKPGRRLCDY